MSLDEMTTEQHETAIKLVFADIASGKIEMLRALLQGDNETQTVSITVIIKVPDEAVNNIRPH